MVENPTMSDADETPGKYSSDDPITFSNLLNKQTDADRDPLKFQKDRSPKHPEIADANEQRQREDSARIDDTPSSDEKQRECLANALIQRYLSRERGKSEYATSSTSHPCPRWYALEKLKYNGHYYYCIFCERFETNLEKDVSIIEFGNKLAFRPVKINRSILHTAISEQRIADFRAARDPVPRLRSKQLEQVEADYESIVKIRTFETKEGVDDRYRDPAPLDIYEQYVIEDNIGEKVRNEVLVKNLSPRQVEVVEQAFIDAVKSSAEVPAWVWQEETSTKFPIIARIELQGK